MAFYHIVRKDIIRQIMTFGIVGILSTIINYGAFLGLYGLFSIHYLLSTGIGFLLGVAFGFVFNKISTFRNTDKIRRALPKYLLVYLFTLIFNILFLKIMVEILHLNPIIANLILTVPIIIINFFGSKLIAFNNSTW